MNYPQFWRTATVVLGFLAAASADGWAASTYTVKNGETLSRIARQNGLSLSALVAANRGMNPDRIVAGQRISIPGTKAAAKPAPAPAPLRKTEPSPKPREDGHQDRMDRTERTHRDEPARRETGRGTYTVKSGDTLSSIARRNGTTIAELQKLNGLRDANHLSLGKTLTLPGGKAEAPRPREEREEHPYVDLTPPPRVERTPAPSRPAREDELPFVNHVVKRHETTSTIARQFGITWAELARANRNIDPNHLEPGQVIRVPVSQTVSNRPMETETISLRQPAEPEDTTRVPSAAPAANPLAQMAPHVSTAAGPRVAVKVTGKDTLETLAEEFHTTARDLRQMNQMSAFDRDVQPGTFVLVPWEAPAASHGQLPYRQT